MIKVFAECSLVHTVLSLNWLHSPFLKKDSGLQGAVSMTVSSSAHCFTVVIHFRQIHTLVGTLSFGIQDYI